MQSCSKAVSGATQAGPHSRVVDMEFPQIDLWETKKLLERSTAGEVQQKHKKQEQKAASEVNWDRAIQSVTKSDPATFIGEVALIQKIVLTRAQDVFATLDLWDCVEAFKLVSFRPAFRPIVTYSQQHDHRKRSWLAEH
jgi:hypothetical protein